MCQSHVCRRSLVLCKPHLKFVQKPFCYLERKLHSLPCYVILKYIAEPRLLAFKGENIGLNCTRGQRKAKSQGSRVPFSWADGFVCVCLFVMRSPYVPQAGFKLAILPLQPPEQWVYRRAWIYRGRLTVMLTFAVNFTGFIITMETHLQMCL